jgi:cytochrome P450
MDMTWFLNYSLNKSPPEIILIGCLIAYVIIVLCHYQRKYSFFKEKGIPGPKPIPLFGNTLDILTKNVPDMEVDLYHKYSGFYGYFDMTQPVLNISDPELIKNIMIRDFSHFVDRRDRTEHRLMKYFLSMLKGDDWRRARNIISPTFTTGKLKVMYSMMTESANDLQKSIGKHEGQCVDLKDIYGFYALDVIVKTSFSKITRVQEVGYNNPFMRYAVKLLQPPKWRAAAMMILPKFLLPLVLKVDGAETIDYLEDVVRGILEQRRSECSQSVRREYHDLLDLMTQRKNEQSLLSDNEAIANGILMLIAGYETTATLLTYASYSLALNQGIQERLREEVASFRELHDEVKYEDISALKLLDAVIQETLRLYPPAIRLERTCTEDYNFDFRGKSHSVRKGDIVRFPIYAIQRDEKYFPDANAFVPDRFLPENERKIKPFTYLPFGGGPRKCLGIRFSLLEAKIALTKTILNYRLLPCRETPKSPDMSHCIVLISSKNIFIKFEKLEQTTKPRSQMH